MQKFVTVVKESLKINMLKIKNIVKLKIIVIMQGNIEVLRITYSIMYLKTFLYFLTMDLTMKNLKDNLLV